MDRKILLYWLAQIGGWGAYYVFSILLLLSSQELVSTFNLLLWVSACIIVSILISHIMRWFILRLNLIVKKLPELLGYTLLFSFISAFTLEWFQYFLDVTINLDFLVSASGEEEEQFSWAIFFLATSRSMILFLLWSGFYYVFIVIEKSRKQELLNLQWESSQNEIELKNLRAQLNPHFLFNSLNSIRALVGINPDQAKTAITQLSTLLRNSINLGKLRLIPLSDEIDLVNHYLKLEQIRFEERLKVKIHVDQSIQNFQIPPLVIQTLVENAIKHGISKAIDGGEIKVNATPINGGVEIVVENTGSLGKDFNEDNGIGINNTRKRLAILFRDNASFSISQNGDMVCAKINIKKS